MRKRFLKRATALAMATAMAAGSATTAFAGQWKQDATGYWWDENGSYPKNEWKWLDGNGDGISESYYFGADGYLLTNTTTPGRLYRKCRRTVGRERRGKDAGDCKKYRFNRKTPVFRKIQRQTVEPCQLYERCR